MFGKGVDAGIGEMFGAVTLVGVIVIDRIDRENYPKTGLMTSNLSLLTYVEKRQFLDQQRLV